MQPTAVTGQKEKMLDLVLWQARQASAENEDGHWLAARQQSTRG